MNEEIYDFVEDAIDAVRQRNGIIMATDVTCITDTIFLEIENNQELKSRYQRLEKMHGGLNAKIGKHIKDILSLTNLGREKYPESTLIKSYEKHGFQD